MHITIKGVSIMAKKNYAEINVKAAAITGAVLGFIWSLFASAAVSGGMMGSFGYGMMAGGTGLLVLIILSTIIWAIIFGFVAVVYNYASKNWS